MKSKTFILSLAALAAAVCFAPTLSAAASARPDKPLGVEVAVEPQFPMGLVGKLQRGYVRVLLSVDEQGKLTEYMVTAYTRKAFAKAVTDVISQWRFDPALRDGVPVSVVSEVNISFEANGMVICSDYMQIVENFLQGWRVDQLEYEPTPLRLIDRIPEPIKVISPVYLVGMEQAGLKGDVTISFYINEEGKVCMPSVVKADHMPLADLAMDALRQWQFNPPTRRGSPVLVKASQTFHFEGKKAAATPASVEQAAR